ncbi:HAMP domain-containing histidine kinase [Antarcticibacterium flavum]|uniref:histidine kinase n=1 Tax=Antarcticibacterium flavum TaxID=2058175 RepID=A0A5B7X9G3_9FLAO|nr:MULTISPECIES: HAMP domain-containing sensor histidine kinase [Antarcticibacterium]MCM4160338.1 histidine kinase [Antarcticibacterium sp. W02-3]QCY71283.1 HAMP domain-containing histidine kinase [Antarcticibacterium flavum]
MEKNYASNEKIRATIIKDYNIDTTSSQPDQGLDQIVFLTSLICKVPVAYISILEPTEICLKAKLGVELTKLPRNKSFTETAYLAGKDYFEICYGENKEIFEEAKKWFKKDFRFYAAVLLQDQQGYTLGALNILDTEERRLENVQVKGLKALSAQAMKLLEFGKQNQQFQLIQDQLRQKYQELEKFASLVSHDLKSPLANIISLTELLKEENKDNFNEETVQYLDYLSESSYSLRNYVDGILSFYRSEHILEKDYENVDLHQLLQGIAKLYDVTDDVIIEYPEEATLHHVNKAALTQIFLNLISNGLKYNKKPVRRISIDFKEEEHFYRFWIKDNGEGFPEEETSRIFELFTTLDTNDRQGNPGSGIGLATVKKLVTSLGGRIEVSSTPGEGSTFSFSIQRI